MQMVAYREGEIIYTSEIVSSWHPSQAPQFDPVPSLGGWNYTSGEYFIPVDSVRAGVLILLMLTLVVLVFWAVIHVLMSLSRMIRAAQKTSALLQLSASLPALHLRLWKLRRRRTLTHSNS
jgi:hypothetical protein